MAGHGLADRGGGGRPQLTELAQRGAARLDRAVAGDLQLTDRLNRTGRVLGDHPRLAGQDLARGGLGVDGVGLAAPAAHVRVRLVDLDHRDACGAQKAGQSSAVGAGGLHTHRDDRPEGLEPGEQRLVAGEVRGELGVGEQPAGGVERHGVMGALVAVHATSDSDHVIVHAGDVLPEGRPVAGTGGQNSDEALVGAGSYQVTSARTGRRSNQSGRPAESTRPRQDTTLMGGSVSW